MDIKTKDIHTLIEKCVKHLQELGYSDACISVHQKRWKDGIIPYMEKCGASSYTPEVGEEYLRWATKDSAPSTKRARKRNIHVLSEYLEKGTIRKRIVHLVNHPLPGAIGQVASEFLDTLRALRRSELTIENHRRMLSYFIAGLELKSVHKVEDIKEQYILDFIDVTPYAKDHHYYTMRLFCRFLYEKRYTGTNLGYVIEHNNFPHHEKLPSVYSAEEVCQVEQSVDQASPVGKRDYAILLLASRLGLRVSDIANLTLDNIDWDTNRIILIQAKTGNPIELPLLPAVGEAIVNYLKYARPVSGLTNIFLTACAPYRPMNRIGLNGVISRIMQGSGVDISKRRFGPHSMRHSLASNLLKNGVSIPIISTALGHESTQTTMEYLRIDTANLMKCTIEVPIVNPNFYEQKGGAFYD